MNIRATCARVFHPRVRLAAYLALLAVVIYRVAFYVPAPGINHEILAAHLQVTQGDAAEQAASLFAMFTAGELGGAER